MPSRLPLRVGSVRVQPKNLQFTVHCKGRGSWFCEGCDIPNVIQIILLNLIQSMQAWGSCQPYRPSAEPKVLKSNVSPSRRKLRVPHCDHSGPGWGAYHVHEWQSMLCRWRQPRLQVGAKLQNSDAPGVTCAIDISTYNAFALLTISTAENMMVESEGVPAGRIWSGTGKKENVRFSHLLLSSIQNLDSKPYSSSSSSSSWSDPHWCWLQWVYNWKPSLWADCGGGKHVGGDF